MLFPSGIEEKLGFHLIREILSGLCQSDAGRELVDGIRFSSDAGIIARQLEETEEVRQLLFLPGLPSLRMAPLGRELALLAVEGSFLEEESLLELKAALINILAVTSFVRKLESGRFPLITAQVSGLLLDRSVLTPLETLLDEKGKVADNASPALLKVRNALAARKKEVTRQLDRVFQQARREGWTEEGLEPTVRGGRLVIPLLAVHKRKVKGIIHDESSTGHTVFLEPEDIFQSNNQIRELELQERREVIKVLVKIASWLRPHLPAIRAAIAMMAKLDFLQAKAAFALKTASLKPRLGETGGVDWIQARHPLLYLSHLSQKKEVVPQHISLDPEHRIMVISGPNAGGKSVCLKTAGLLQYMVQCGLLVPAKEGSSAGVFQDIFIELGDEQSLENDLSTYSSHLQHMQFFMEHAGPYTLFLIDEMGSGTEPQVGGAIAEVVLKVLNDRGAYGVVTTHYTNLKVMASSHPGMFNAAMAFDRTRMEPLFKLETGRPGSSFAIEIARKMGFEEDLLGQAMTLAGRAQFDFDHQIQELELQKKTLESKTTGFQVADAFLAEMIGKYEKMLADLEKSRRQEMDKARQAASKLLAESNSLIERTIREIRESQAEREKTRRVRSEFNQAREALEQLLVSDPAPAEPELRPDKSGKRPGKVERLQKDSGQAESGRSKDKQPGFVKDVPPVKGDWVRMQGQQAAGLLEDLRGQEAVVRFGDVRVKCQAGQLHRLGPDEIPVPASGSSVKYGNFIRDLNQRMAEFKLTLDLRGKRAEEARQMLQLYMDEAVLLDVFEVRILHGKGDGILREVVRQYLQGIPEVKSYRDEILELGGHGITVVSLRQVS
ncbi:MAG TPA: Smr/MutS family protein [Bacteroidales bacterium]|nr:Smr/MutS family protein [Bacteroidales bacterium]HSA44363.1 Smr/MutS family protein [Bacteroidales bacterium]